MHKRQTGPWLGVTFILLILLYSRAGAAEPPPVRVALNSWTGQGVYYVAESLKLFAREGVQVELVDVNDFSSAQQLLASGRVDVAALTPETLHILHQAGVNAKGFAATDRSMGADGLVVAGEIRGISDLQGKEIVLELGTASHVLVGAALLRGGVSPGAVTFVNMAAPDAAAAFLSGRPPAIATWEPWLTQALNRPGSKALVTSRTVPLLPNLAIALETTISQRKPALAALLRAVFAARDLLVRKDTAALEIVRSKFELTQAALNHQVENLVWLSAEDARAMFSDHGEGSAEAIVGESGKVCQALGLVKEASSPERLLDRGVLDLTVIVGK